MAHWLSFSLKAIVKNTAFRHLPHPPSSVYLIDPPGSIGRSIPSPIVFCASSLSFSLFSVIIRTVVGRGSKKSIQFNMCDFLPAFSF